MEFKRKIRNIKKMMRQTSKSSVLRIARTTARRLAINYVCELIAEVACDVLESYVGLPIVRRISFFPRGT